MQSGSYIALRGVNSYHLVDRQAIREVEMGARHTRIITPYNVIEIENRYNVDALNSLCEEPVPEYAPGRRANGRELYPRLTDLPF
ncbi:MAG: hypothetical protein KKG00_14185 [Bacteroidetes bacterium]|nr:hypothetical protein [Bacteroidota bacterium]